MNEQPKGRPAGAPRGTATAATPAPSAATSTPARVDPVLEMLNHAMRDSVTRAALLNCGFLKKVKHPEAGQPPVQWACEPAQVVVAIKLAEQYGLDLMQRHLLPLEGKVYTTRDAMVYSAQKSGSLLGIEQEDEAVLVDRLGRALAQDPLAVVSDAALHDESSMPTGAEWRVWVVAQRASAGRYRFQGRYPFWRKRNEWGGPAGKRRPTFDRWEPHPYGPEMAVKCAEAAALRRGWNIALPTIDEVGGFGDLAAATSTGGGDIGDLQERAGADRGGVAGLASDLGVDPPGPGPDDIEAPSDPLQGADDAREPGEEG